MNTAELKRRVSKLERRMSAGCRKVRFIVLYGDESADAVTREPDTDYVFYHVRRDGSGRH